MELSNLTFIVTDDCNFNCSYCFQKKEKKTISNKIIETAVDFFYPFLTKKNKVHIGFYGGEPLLAFEQVKHAVLLLMEKNKTGNKNLEFSLTTNGSLLTGKMLDFFNRRRFALMLSFDGLAQDIGRKKGTLEKMIRSMKRIRRYPGITFEINSVFSPRTVHMLSDSLRFIIERGGAEVTFDISTIEEWIPAELDTLEEELARLTDFLHSYYKKNGEIPVTNFRNCIQETKPGIFRCGAGRDQVAVTPEGDVYGCFLFHDYFKDRRDSSRRPDFHFGTLAGFAVDYKTRYPQVLAHYAELWQGFFSVERDFCFLCPDVEGCMVCPVNAAYSTGTLGKISRGRCRVNKILRKFTNHFLQLLTTGWRC
ncbi:MAG: radical SAM protein [Candidatus Aminicenantes bacterium]|nr:radical SAM protein [Candidatus Aminicenantes bacterium]